MSSIGSTEAADSSWSEFVSDDTWMRMKAAVFQGASYLTDPICQCHEYFRRFCIVDALHPLASKTENWARKSFLIIGLAIWALAATVTTLAGIALRYAISRYQKEPFIALKGEGPEKKLQKGEEFSILNWNVCCTAGGYSISDGGVMPWSFRIDALAQKIRDQDADVVSLYELFDMSAAYRLYQALRTDYAYFYLNIGPRAIGVASGIFIASKFEIKNPSFIAFPKEMLVGRTKYAEKGVFSFDIVNDGINIARIFSTHLQHTEKRLDDPEAEEIEARGKEMELIIAQIDQVKDRCVVLAGDLNLDKKEYTNSTWSNRFDQQETAETWGGDELCATMVGKPVSPSLVLDYTLVVKGTGEITETVLVETGYDASKITPEALSDHKGLRSKIRCELPGSYRKDKERYSQQ